MVASTASPSPTLPAADPQSPPQPPLTPPGGTAADSPDPTFDIAHATFRAPLSQTDACLLSHILRYRLDLEAAALPLGTDTATLLDFADRPDIKLRIESYQRLRLASINDKVLDLTASTRIDAIQQLSQLIKEVDNPVEKRRAIDLILRYTGPIPPPNPRSRPNSYPSSNSSPSYSPARRTRTDADSSSTLSNFKSQISNSTPSSSPTPPPIPPPPQSSDPLALALATHIENLLTPEKKTPESLVPALHACFAPRAKLNKFPVPSDPSAFAKSIHPDITKLLCLPATLIERTTKATGPNSHIESLWLIPHRGPQYIVTLTLARETTESPWLLHTLDTT